MSGVADATGGSQEAPTNDMAAAQAAMDAAFAAEEDTQGGDSEAGEAQNEGEAQSSGPSGDDGAGSPPAASASPPGASEPSRAEQIRAAALERKKAFEERDQARAPAAPQSPFGDLQTSELQKALEFQRLFQANPMEAIRRAGHDTSKVYEQITQEALNPGSTDIGQKTDAFAAELKAIREQQERLAQSQQDWQRQQETAKKHQRYVTEMNRMRESDTYKYSGKLDEATLVDYALREQAAFQREYGQVELSPADLLDLVEDRLTGLQRQLGGTTTEEARGSGDTKEAGKAAGNATQSQTLTNDLASQTATPAEVSHDPDSAYRAALKAAAQIQYDD